MYDATSVLKALYDITLGNVLLLRLVAWQSMQLQLMNKIMSEP